MRKDYEKADLDGRSCLLDEAQTRTGYNRKYLIRILNQPGKPDRREQRRKRLCRK